MQQNTIELVFVVQGAARDILLARLAGAGCDAFEETEAELRAYIQEAGYDASLIKAIAGELNHEFSERSIAPQNWNAVWEASFEPVIVPRFCTVRAGFHPPAADTPYEVIITPKMSFGTGHHATTRLMMQAISETEFSGKNVLDFGTGTGILAILAGKLGASSVLAIDNDEWSTENARENVLANNAAGIQVLQGSLNVATARNERYDIILANINRHILLECMPEMGGRLTSAGVLLLSGILYADEAIIRAAAENSRLLHVKTLREGDWSAMKFTA